MGPVTRFPVWATIFLAIGICVLCALGGWQIQRLHWKNNLIAEIDALWRAKPQPLSVQEIHEAAETGKNFLRGSMRGTFLNQKTFRIGPRMMNGQPGFHIITPFAPEGGSGSIILVNRGWAQATAETIPDAQDVEIQGLLRRPDKPNMFSPPNDPARGIWYTIDPEAIAKKYETGAIEPFVFYYEETPHRAFPVPVGARPDLNNNHLSYAIFWFAMAFVMLVIYGIWLRRDRCYSDSPEAGS